MNINKKNELLFSFMNRTGVLVDSFCGKKKNRILSGYGQSLLFSVFMCFFSLIRIKKILLASTF